MNHLERAQLLLSQSRPELAENEVRKLLAIVPDLPEGHALLSVCLSHQEQHAKALDSARHAVHLGPDLPYVHYAHGLALLGADRYEQAATAIREAIKLDPEDADYYGLLALILYHRRNWSEALDAAEHGLAIDAEHDGCANARAMALVKLGRRAEAANTIETALERDPENALTHANQGWAMLHANQPAKAMEHFREALRIDPELQWARDGIVEALKARNFIYRLMLQYFLFMARLSPGWQWGLILGFYFGQKFLRNLAGTYPQIEPYVKPIVLAYLVFALMTWIADPLFNLLLRLNRFGRLALSDDDRRATNWFGGFMFIAGMSIVAYFATKIDVLLYLSLGCGLMLLPISGTFARPPGKARTFLALYTAGLGLLIVAGLALELAGGPGMALGALFLLGVFAFQWVAIALSVRRPA